MAVLGMTIAGAAALAGVPADDGGRTPLDPVRSGDTLFLNVEIGAVRIEREVSALQPARPGQRLFVKDSEGRILSARYREASR